ncbi:MAG: glycosyltransferase family 39 protein [Pirellulaceae bacterium]
MKPFATLLLRHQTIVVAVASVALLTNLGATRLWDQDEAYFAGAAAEMHARGDWVTPYFNQELFAHKPPVMYWLMIAGYEVFGRNEFAARIGSALFGVATGLLVYHAGRRLFSPAVGLWSALAIVTCLMFDVVARAATPDCHLVFFTALAIYLFATWCPEARLVESDAHGLDDDPAQARDRRRRSLIGWSLVYAAMGVAVLVKGPIGVLLPCCVIGLYLMLSTPRGAPAPSDASTTFKQRVWALLTRLGPLSFLQSAWRMKPWLLLLVVALTAGPWFLLVDLRTGGAFTHEFVWTHHVQRFLHPLDNHQGPWWYYVPAMLVGFFPWSVFVVPAGIELVRRIRRGGRRGRAALLLLCWLLVFVLFFSKASTKLPNYVLPAYPALALAIGCYLVRWRKAPQLTGLAWTRVALTTLAICGLLLSLAYPVATTPVFNGQTLLETLQATPLLAGDLAWAALLGAITCGGALLCLAFDLLNRRAWVLPAFACTSLVFVTGALGGVALRIDRHQPSEDVASAIRRHSDDRAPLVAQYGYFRPSLVYYTGGRLQSLKTSGDVARLLRESPDAYVVLPEDKYQRLRDKLPAGVVVIARQPRFPKQGEILVLANSPPRVAEKPAASQH